MSWFVVAVVIFQTAVFAAGVAIWCRRHFARERRMRFSLEKTQKDLDYQLSRLHVLNRSLANVRDFLVSPNAPESGKTLFVDEARALVRADGASFWRYREREQTFELEVAVGEETGSWLPMDGEAPEGKENPGAVFRRRRPVLLADPVGGDGRCMLVPLDVGKRLLGVFRVRRTSLPFEPWDVDLVGMFVSQIGIALENREMLGNRETFYLEFVQSIADLLDARDAASNGNTRQTRSLARGMARELSLPDEFVFYLEFAALLHDIGKMAIDEQLLRKPGKLTPEEFNILKKHPELGHKILEPVSMLAPVAPMVLYHQEWFNGNGYPAGLAGEEIPLGARIVALLDAWSAMTSLRPWRGPLTVDAAVKEIVKGSGSQFDPRLVEALLTVLRKQGMAA